MFGFLRRPSANLSAELSDGSSARPLKLLVIAADKDKADWADMMQGTVLDDGRSIDVVQCGWDDIRVSAEPKSSVPILVHLPKSRAAPKRPTSFQPDFVLVRNEVSCPGNDFRNQMFGLMFAGISSVNSFHSIYQFCEKAVVTAELFKISRRCGLDENGEEIFPLMPMQYFASHQEMMYTQEFPAVCKIGSAHAGVGKMKVPDHHAMEDFRSVMAMTGNYCTAEPFLEGDYDLRVQKIGRHYRVFKRTSMSGEWKTNTGTSVCEEIELTPKYQRWADEASNMFGGLDICTVDAIHEASTGKEYILEVNGTSSGLAPDSKDEDNEHIKEVVLAKMNAEFCGTSAAAEGASASEPQTAGLAAAAEDPGTRS